MAEQELPDEQERHEPAPAFPAECFEQVEVRAARAGQGRAQLAPDEAVRQDQGAGCEPGEHGVRPRQQAEDERNRGENAGTDNHRHVERGCLEHAEMPL
jgi:hypothetical protein